jgi:ATP-dependent Clp protease ATP-binding subunit ClpA
MFERYTEKARRVIFFARYEASEVGSPYIESEHILVGLMRESGHVLKRYLGAEVTMEELREEIKAYAIRRPSTSTSVDLPLSNECKRILAYAAEEAMRFEHQHIGTEHLMLGILRESDCLAASLLQKRGANLEAARRSIAADARVATLAQASGTTGSETSFSAIGSGGVPRRSLSGYRVVDEETRETLLIWADSTAIPRIGETISISREPNAQEFFRVRDVVWEFNIVDGVSQLRQLVVKVAKDAGASPAELQT